MPNESSIAAYISEIENAVYGRQVRSAIANGIRQCYTDVSNGVTLTDQCISDCNDKIDEMDEIIGQAQQAVTNAGIAEEHANTAAETAETVLTDMSASILDTKDYLGIR